MTTKENIKHLTGKFFQEISDHYRYLHQHPELSFEEEKTAQYVANFLRREKIEFRSGIGGHGILAQIVGRKAGNGKTIALVADMDALPVSEDNTVDYKSMHPGVMHACGHDTHTATLMGAAKIINALCDHFSGTVLFVFQPGEERSPGGAKLMLDDGLFNGYNPAFIVKQHAYVDLEAESVAFQSGVVMASADEIHIKVMGEGGHGALPHQLNDTVLAASAIIMSLQQIVSRRRDPFQPMTLSFGKFIANGATNVIPGEVVLAGSLRCMDEIERKKMLVMIPAIITNTARAYGCDAVVEIPPGYPTTISHKEITDNMKHKATDFLGADYVGEYPKRMTAEDFGFYSQLYPCCFYRFGVNNETMSCGKLHSSTFLIDERALYTATSLLAYIAVDSCK